jgi:signal transduction histidine kinase
MTQLYHGDDAANRASSQSEHDAPWARRRLLPVTALAFVVVSLLALGTLPVVVAEWFQRARQEAEVGVLPARTHAVRLALSTERQVSAARGYVISADPAQRHRFDQARLVQTQSLDELAEAGPLLGAAAQEHMARVRVLADRWHARLLEAFEARARGEEYVAVMGELEGVHDSLLMHVAAIEDAAVRANAMQLGEAAAALRLQRSLGVSLGALALLAAGVVGWLARSEWHLARRVEQALQEESKHHAVAEHARVELVRLTESRARLMRGFSHDVKNPLSAADGYLQLLDEGLMGPLTEQQRRAVQRASRSIGGALNLVDDLVELARAEAGQLEIARDPTDLLQVVAEAVDEYHAQAEARGLGLYIDAPAEFPLVYTDGRRVRQILGNLISNAVKYTREGSATVRLRMPATDPTDERDRHVVIEVEDTGPGIPAEQQRRLFEEFVRLDTGAATGAGLGLAISNRLARALGGQLTVSSEPGRGSTFGLVLPLRRSSDVRV